MVSVTTENRLQVPANMERARDAIPSPLSLFLLALALLPPFPDFALKLKGITEIANQKLTDCLEQDAMKWYNTVKTGAWGVETKVLIGT